MIPFSAEAVNNLVATEREHCQERNLRGPSCNAEEPGEGIHYWKIWPCPTLLSARSNASEETLVAVALILGGERK